MVHLARKAFFLASRHSRCSHRHWMEVREMIAFRDTTVRRLGLDLLVHTNAEGKARGIQPDPPRDQRCTPGS